MTAQPASGDLDELAVPVVQRAHRHDDADLAGVLGERVAQVGPGVHETGGQAPPPASTSSSASAASGLSSPAARARSAVSRAIAT